MRCSTAESSRVQTSAALFASLRRCKIGFFSVSNLANASFCSRVFSCRCLSIFLIPSSICAMRSATSFCSCSSFFSATLSLRSSGKLPACEVPSRPRLISLLCNKRLSWRNAMRVLCRRIFNPTSRTPVRMKLTSEGYAKRAFEKEIFASDTHLLSLLRLGQLRQDAEIFQRGCVAGDFSPARYFLEKPAHDFSAACLWQRLGKANFVGLCNRTDVFSNVLAQTGLQRICRFNICFQRDKRDYSLTFQLVRPSHHRSFRDRRVTYQGTFDF